MQPNTTHPNSHKVTILRKPAATQEQADLKEYYALTYQSLGGYFEPGGSQKSSSGMEYWEETILMPYLIDVPAEDKEFRKKVASFNDDINTSIPYHGGKTLEIGLLEDNTKALRAPKGQDDLGNLPINPLEYVRWRHALKHPECAGTKEEATNSMLKTFYIFDPKAESNTSFVGLEEKDDAITQYLTIKSDSSKVEMHLSLLGVDSRGVNEKDRVTLLRKVVEDKPAEFLNNVSDKDNEERFFINQLLAGRVLELVGSSYLVRETGENLGYTVKEVVEFLKNKANSQIKSVLKAQLQDVRKTKKLAEKTA